MFGGLQDKDRIFTNIYGKHDPFIQVRAAAAGAAASRRRRTLAAPAVAAGSGAGEHVRGRSGSSGRAAWPPRKPPRR